MTFTLLFASILLAVITYFVAFALTSYYFTLPAARKHTSALDQELTLIHSRWIASERALLDAQSELTRQATQNTLRKVS